MNWESVKVDSYSSICERIRDIGGLNMKSSRFLIVILAILPLGVLASVNLLGALQVGQSGVNGLPRTHAPLSGSESAADRKKLMEEWEKAVADREKLATEAAANLRDTKPNVEKLNAFDLFGKDIMKEFPETAETSPFSSIAKSWNSVIQAQGLAVKLGDLFKSVNAIKNGAERTTEELKAISNALADAQIDSCPGGPEVKKLLETRKKSLDSQSQLEKKLIAAHAAFKGKQWAECLKQLEDISTTDLPEDQAREIQELKGHAEFKNHWKNAPPVTDPASSRLTTLEDLIKRSPKANGDEEESELKKQNENLAAARSAVMIDEFFKNPPQELRELVERCEQIVREDASTSKRLGQAIKKHLKSKLPEKKGNPFLDTIQEVRFIKSNKYESGVFVYVGGADEAYQFWKTIAKHKSDPDGYSTMFLKDFQGRPGPALDVVVAKTYNEMCRDLVLHPEDKEKWTALENACTEWQKQVDEYYTQRTVSMKIRFQEEQQLAHDVLELWSSIAPFLSN